MSYLFYIDEKNSVVLRPDCVKLCQELSVLDEKEVLLIILIYDYHSIYKQFPEADRRRKAMIHVYGESIPEVFEKRKIIDAIEAYKMLQYDPKIELARTYQKKIDKLLEIMEGDDSATSIKRTTDTIDVLRKSIRELENEVAENVIGKGQLKGGQELSFLEELQKNVKYYKSIILKK